MKRSSMFGLPALLLALGSACGSYPPPTERMTTSEAAIRAADEMGAGQVPRAALHLKLAQEQTDSARYRFIASDAPEQFLRVGGRFLGSSIDRVETVTLG